MEIAIGNSEEFIKGYDAFMDGADIEDNPYRVNSDAYRDWEFGFNKADIDNNNNDD